MQQPSNICPRCNFENRPGELICSQCLLQLDRHLSTRQMLPSEQILPARNVGSVRFPPQVRLMFHIGDSENGVVRIEQAIVDQLTLGRSQQGTAGKPDLDLAPYHGLEQGVSRLHAVIKRGNDMLTIVDPGSTNGTWVNGTPLEPGVPRVLVESSRIWLGQLTMNIYFVLS